jgi:plasmid segregation protein ParM
MTLRIGLDVGHSAVKVAATNGSGKVAKLLFPTLVMPAFPLLDERTAEAAKADTVQYEGREYFTGRTAEQQGRLSAYTGQDRNWVMTPTHDILVLSALNRVTATFGGNLRAAILTIGLPAAYYSAQRGALQARIQDLIARTYGKDVSETVRVRVQPQPYGPLNIIALNEDGTPPIDRNIDEEAWGVIEIGHFTTDFILISSGDVIENASGSSEGLRAIYERMNAEFVPRDYANAPADLTQALVTRKIRHFGKEIDVGDIVDRSVEGIANEIVSETQRLFGPYAAKLNGVLIAGGGAALIAPRIRAIYPHTMLLDSPRYAVAEGFRRYSAFCGLQQVPAASKEA